jgi:hypothetical protein
MIEIEKQKYQFKKFIEIKEKQQSKGWWPIDKKKKTQGGWDFKKINLKNYFKWNK